MKDKLEDHRTHSFTAETEQDKKFRKKLGLDVTYVKVDSLEEYKALPKKQRVKYGFWYILPDGLPCDWFDDENKDKGWDACHKFLRKEFPIQHRLREAVSVIGSEWRRFKRIWHEKVTCRINPKQKWLTKQIPRTWTDKTHLIPHILFACIVHFVEEEMDIVDWTWDEPHQEAAKEIREIYNYIKVERPKLVKEYEKEYKYEEEKKLDILDESYMIRIVRLYKWLWT